MKAFERKSLNEKPATQSVAGGIGELKFLAHYRAPNRTSLGSSALSISAKPPSTKKINPVTLMAVRTTMSTGWLVK